MNTNTMELNLNEMEAVSGGTYWERIKKQFGWRDLVGIVLFGPIGEVKALGKLIAEIGEDDD